MNPNLMHRMAQDRRAELLRAAEEHRHRGLTARPLVLIRITARIPRFPRLTTGSVQVSSRTGQLHSTADKATQNYGVAE